MPTSPAPAAGLVVLAPLAIEAAAVRGALPAATVVRSGMGLDRARRAARAVRPGDAVAVAGLCGGVAPGLRAGDVVVASEIHAPDGTVTRLPSAPILVAALRSRGIAARLGPVATSERVATGAARLALRETGVLAVDMESSALAAAADGRPLAVLRVVVDTADAGLLRPGVVPAGVRGLRALRAAAAALADWHAAVGDREVVLAAPRSFCAGVERAIEIVERALDRFGAPVYVRKQIVHNVHVVRDLERRGAVFVDELDAVPEGATVVFSAHGVSPAVSAEADRRGLAVVDATCPLVAKVHSEARRFARAGSTVVLIGHAGHEEVEGTLGEAPDALRLVETADDVDRLDVADPERVAYLMQTTLAVDEAEAIAERLRERFPAVTGPKSDDICYATTNRQEAVRAIAAECDVVLVVGSTNSSNSLRLVEVAGRAGARAHLLDDVTELDPAWIAGARAVGVTAGASAPPALVDRIVDALSGLGRLAVRERRVTQETLQFQLPKEVS
jgi:4-hydroxy-3-methylbut-2-enyl diphosphate reductase